MVEKKACTLGWFTLTTFVEIILLIIKLRFETTSWSESRKKLRLRKFSKNKFCLESFLGHVRKKYFCGLIKKISTLVKNFRLGGACFEKKNTSAKLGLGKFSEFFFWPFSGHFRKKYFFGLTKKISFFVKIFRLGGGLF